MTKLTFLLLGAGLSAAVGVTIASIQSSATYIPGSSIITGNQFIVTGDNPTPRVIVDTTEVMTMSGSDQIEFMVPTRTSFLSGALTLTGETPSRSSGVLVITNTSQSTLVCSKIQFFVTTVPSPATTVDIYSSTGTLVADTQTGETIANNFSFPLGLTTFSGATIGLLKGNVEDI